MWRKPSNRSQVDDFDHTMTSNATADVYDELGAYDRHEDNPYWSYVERVKRYVDQASETDSRDSPSEPHSKGYDEAQDNIGHPIGSSSGERGYKDENESEAPYRRSLMSPNLKRACSSPRAWRSNEASEDAVAEVDIEEGGHYADGGITHGRTSFSEGHLHTNEIIPGDRTTSFLLPEDINFQTGALHTVAARLGKTSLMNDFDAELLEIIKAYYECRQLGFPGVAHAGYQHQGSDFSGEYSPINVPVGGASRGNSKPLCSPTHSLALNEFSNVRPQELSPFTRSAPSHASTQFPQPRSLPTLFLTTQSGLRPRNDTNLASGGGDGNLFYPPPSVPNRESGPLISTAASSIDTVPGYRRGPGRFSSGDSAERNFSTRFPSSSPTSFVRAYVLDVNINLEPAIAVTGIASLLNIIVVCFLQNHVLDTRDHLCLFLVGSYLTFSSYYMIYYFLERDSSSFRRIASIDKKFYIIGNLIKAGILISITPFAMFHLIRIVLYDEWESHILRNLGCIFTLPDFVAMIIVKRMRWSTWIHHLCVVVFNYFSIMNDYKKENIFRCIVVYAGFSSFGYCVNVLLASRFLGLSTSLAHILSFAALVVYGLCCSINWSWQVYYLVRLIRRGKDLWSVYLYLVLICFVVWDDIVLNKWLLNHAKNMAYAASKKQRP
ncbi:unnamed protein product [Phytomonas sp. EM1]|nr:unnamed protein product [Phytomonas sp. EM1]|eukprot:CCW63996.1 unnamed protein product [Phytomonas sp. isolate EM1]